MDGCPDSSHDASAATVAIIGAGAAGLLTAHHIARAASGNNHAVRSATRIVLVDPSPAPSAGPAYSTTRPEHLLNVPAGRMAAQLDDPDGFVRWLAARGVPVERAAFVARSHFGQYLHDALRAAVASSRVVLERRNTRALEVAVGPTTRVALADGTSIVAEHVVLALGSAAPRPLADDLAVRIIDDVWGTPWIERVRPHDAVLVVGSGLTAVDAVLSLDAVGHRGPVMLASRHGLLPAVHAERAAAPFDVPPALLDARLTSAREVVAHVHAMLRAAAHGGQPWHDVVDALRPCTASLWRGLGDDERARLLRHVRPRWERHRHRMSPMAAAVLDEIARDGRLRVVAGEVTALEPGRRAVDVSLRGRHGGVTQLRAAWVLNCTGPRHELAARRDALLTTLVRAGAARPGPLGLGLDVAPNGALRDGHGVEHRTISVLGALRIGCEWESTAIPEIRAQAAAIAARLRASEPVVAR